MAKARIQFDTVTWQLIADALENYPDWRLQKTRFSILGAIDKGDSGIARNYAPNKITPEKVGGSNTPITRISGEVIYNQWKAGITPHVDNLDEFCEYLEINNLSTPETNQLVEDVLMGRFETVTAKLKSGEVRLEDLL